MNELIEGGVYRDKPERLGSFTVLALGVCEPVGAAHAVCVKSGIQIIVVPYGHFHFPVFFASPQLVGHVQLDREIRGEGVLSGRVLVRVRKVNGRIVLDEIARFAEPITTAEDLHQRDPRLQ